MCQYVPILIFGKSVSTCRDALFLPVNFLKRCHLVPSGAICAGKTVVGRRPCPERVRESCSAEMDQGPRPHGANTWLRPFLRICSNGCWRTGTLAPAAALSERRATPSFRYGPVKLGLKTSQGVVHPSAVVLREGRGRCSALQVRGEARR